MDGSLRLWLLPVLLHGAFLAGYWSFAQSDNRNAIRSASAPPSSRYDVDPVFRQTLVCGPNSLYMLLRLNGVSADRGIISKYTHLHPQGMSLAELREASNSLGLRTEVRRCSLDEFRRQFELPVIAYLLSDVRAHDVDDVPGHYVVVIGIGNGTITMIDGTTGERRRDLVGQWLAKRWSGYVLVPNNTHSISWLFLATLPFGWMSLFLLTLRRRRIS